MSEAAAGHPHLLRGQYAVDSGDAPKIEIPPPADQMHMYHFRHILLLFDFFATNLLKNLHIIAIWSIFAYILIRLATFYQHVFDPDCFMANNLYLCAKRRNKMDETSKKSKNSNRDYNRKREEFSVLFMTGKYTQQELADMLGVSRVTISGWTRKHSVPMYNRVRENMIRELERLSAHPEGKEELIFKYIEYLDRLETMIRKVKFIPNSQIK